MLTLQIMNAGNMGVMSYLGRALRSQSALVIIVVQNCQIMKHSFLADRSACILLVLMYFL